MSLPVDLPAPQLHGAGCARATLVMVPALGVPARVYRGLGEALAARGVACAVTELRATAGDGPAPGRANDYGYLDVVHGEIAAAVAAVRASAPDAPCLLAGHSMGGQQALLYAALHPQQATAGVALAASGSPHWRTFSGARAAGVAAFARLVQASCALLGHFPGHWFGFGGRQPPTLMREWARFVLDGRLQPHDAALDIEATWASLELPVHGLAMRGDGYCPSASTQALLDRGRGPRHLETLDALPDGTTPGHFAWLRQPDPVADWLAAVATSP